MRARPEHAPHLAGTRQIAAIPGTEREVLALARLEAGQPWLAVLSWDDRGLVARARPGGRLLGSGSGEPVVRVRPARYLLGILARGLDSGGERRELVTAALADDSERLSVPDQLQSDLVWLTHLVVTRDRVHSQEGSIYAA